MTLLTTEQLEKAASDLRVMIGAGTIDTWEELAKYGVDKP